MHAYEKIRQEIEQDDDFEQTINTIKGKIYNQG
jgi:chromosomal replication initiation ATPase DnaA